MLHRTAALTACLLLASPVAADDAMQALLERHCLGCHSAQGQAPVRFGSLEGVLRHRGLMRALLEDGTMPPALAAETPVALSHARRLAARDRDALLAALATRESAERAFAGLREAKASAAPATGAFGPAAAWTMPAEGGMRVRTYLVDVAADAPLRVRGVRIADPAALQWSPLRMISLAPDPKRAFAPLIAAEEHGAESMGNVGRNPSGALGAVSRVRTAFELPAGYAFDLPRGAVAVETLGEPVGREAPVDPRLAWIPATGADVRTVRSAAFFPRNLVLEPEARLERTVEFAAPQDIDIVAFVVKGGAFLRGVTAEVVDPSQCVTRVLDVPDFRMSLAEPWTLEKPLRVTRGSSVVMRFRFDNTAQNPQQPTRPPARVTGGLPPMGEDALGVMLYAEAPSGAGE
ncbi:MAG: hypothetical protein ACKOYN_03795 [Planctomycetota bacterium]